MLEVRQRKQIVREEEIALREKGKIVQEEAVQGNFAENSGRMGGEGGHEKVESPGILCPCHSGT